MSVTIPMKSTPLPRVTVAQIHKAMAASIKHWKRIVAGEDDHSIDDRDCALCQLFAPGGVCAYGKVECPVYARSGWPYCAQTPWNDVVRHLYVTHRRLCRINTKTCPTCKELALQELCYLKLAQKYNMPRRSPCRRKPKTR